MNRLVIFLIAVSFAACSSSHKLTGTNFVDLQSETAPEVPADYPFEVIEDAEWTDMSEEIKSMKEEELRFWIHSSFPPSALYKITKKRRKYRGEFILYWEKRKGDFQHLQLKRYLEGSCTEFFETESYNYCYPEYEEGKEPNWELTFKNIEDNDVWKIPDMGGLNEQVTANDNWKIYTQVKLGSFYRDYMHLNPNKYSSPEVRKKLMGISSNLKEASWKSKDAVKTNVVEGLTNGTSFMLCDSSESWQIENNFNTMLLNSAYNLKIDTRDKKTFYYVLLKGRVSNNWFPERVQEDKNRKLTLTAIYALQRTENKKCPEGIAP